MKGAFAALLLLGLSGWTGCQSGPRAERNASASSEGPSVDHAGRPTAPPESESDCFVMLDGEPDYGAPPLTVRFETEANCTGGPVEFSWDFGDGSTGGNVPGPSHTYERQGEYVATVRVRAPDGGRSEDELEITVDATFEE